MMFAEKYGWTPQEIAAIPKKTMEEWMMALNMKLNVNKEIEMRNKYNMEDPQAGAPVIGNGGIRYKKEL